MTTRTLHTPDDTEWTLAEASVGTDAEREDAAADGTVPVVATPSGGAQSVRLELAPDWETMDDAALADAVGAAR
ncbi:hypothetical protein [Rubrivirga sp.]|uniref:hypothetical protein n=1 Tax=Rubrivirga sp. TaxID=1885344 RepID=UPI003B52293D